METDTLLSARRATSTRSSELQYMSTEPAGLKIGQLYLYTPNDTCPRFSLYQLAYVNQSMFVGNLHSPTLVMVVERSQNWMHIISPRLQGWAQLPTKFQCDTTLFRPRTSYKEYESLASRHRFFFDGRLMTGPDLWYFQLTIGSLIFFGSTSVLYIASQFSNQYAHLLVGITALLILFALINLLIAGCMDPGILPRRAKHLPPRKPFSHTLTLDLGFKYCETCNVYRPPRGKHCRFCDACCDKFDHHCPFISTCVGRRNERFFVRFVVSLTLFLIWVTVLAVVLLMDVVLNGVSDSAEYTASAQSETQTDSQTALNTASEPLTVRLADAVLAHPFALAFLLLGISTLTVFLRFCLYHVRLRWIDRTTNECERRRRQQQQQQQQQQQVYSVSGVQSTDEPIEEDEKSVEELVEAQRRLQSSLISSSSSVSTYQQPSSSQSSGLKSNLFATFTSGGISNYVSVCCGALPASRLGNLRRTRTVSDFVCAFVDVEKYPQLQQVLQRQGVKWRRRDLERDDEEEEDDDNNSEGRRDEEEEERVSEFGESNYDTDTFSE